uniref:Phlebovirus_G2 domain-containing protein n=1 Tax=Steinernema glaseri TaxID=37863 RepID=A0A1I8AM43_9BILA
MEVVRNSQGHIREARVRLPKGTTLLRPKKSSTKTTTRKKLPRRQRIPRKNPETTRDPEKNARTPRQQSQSHLQSLYSIHQGRKPDGTYVHVHVNYADSSEDDDTSKTSNKAVYHFHYSTTPRMWRNLLLVILICGQLISATDHHELTKKKAIETLYRRIYDCTESCSGPGCDCFYWSSGCLFYRIYYEPMDRTLKDFVVTHSKYSKPAKRVCN